MACKLSERYLAEIVASMTSKGEYVADFFAGSGRVSRAVRKAGFSAREWEILKGPDGDLTIGHVF